MSNEQNPAAPSAPLQVIEEAAMPAPLDAAIRELLCTCFTDEASRAAFSVSRHWHGSKPEFSLVLTGDQRVLGNIGIVVRTIACGGRQTRIAGIQNLAVHPDARKSGLSRRLMTESMQEAARRGVRWGLLFCVPGLERFYASLGWKRCDVPVTEHDERGRSVPITAKNIAMTLDLAKEPFPKGAIDLQGRDW